MIANSNMYFEHKLATKWENLFIASKYYSNNNNTVAYTIAVVNEELAV